MAEKYCLRWNDFQANVTSSFRKLRNADDFYDVTLVSDDHQQVSAHKVVLSASSEYFKNILKKNKHSHPLLCLNGVKFNDLHNILDYIYNGEIQIFQDDLDSFLATAKRFQLEGLNQGKEDNDEMTHVKNENIEDDFMPLVSNSENDSKSGKKERTISVQSFNFENIAELDKKIEEFITRQLDGTYQCTTCGKISKAKKDIKEHVEVHFDGLSFPCRYCDKSLRSRASLRVHISTIHITKNRCQKIAH